jgi:hypothetical protein
MLSWSAVVSLSSDSGSASFTARTAEETALSLRNSSGPLTSVTRPRMSDAFGFAMVGSPCHTARTARPAGARPYLAVARPAQSMQVRATGRASSRAGAIGPPHASHEP